MTLTDIIILIVVSLLLLSIIFFNFIFPKIKHEDSCCNCPYKCSCHTKENCKKD